LQSDVLSRLTFSSKLSFTPVWTADGKHIAYSSERRSLFWMRSDGAGQPQKLLDANALVEPYSLTPDGKRLAFQQQSSASNYDIWTLPLDTTDPDRPKPGKPEPFANSAANEIQPAFSSDGRWVAFASDESGTHEIYVRPFPPESAGGRWQISSGGGKMPAWAPGGKKLFFENPAGQIMVATYELNGVSFVAGKPRLWSDRQLAAPTLDANFDVAPDGQSVVALFSQAGSGEGKPSLHLTFIVNFFETLRQRASR
jgi:serine/threonine-protein kinase